MSHTYSDLFNAHEAMMLQDADNAITACNFWEWLRDYTPEDNKGYMFSNHPNLTKINLAMKYGGHSGASYGWTMKQMEYIAKHGWTLFEFKVREQRKKQEEEDKLMNTARKMYHETHHYRDLSEDLKTCTEKQRPVIIEGMMKEYLGFYDYVKNKNQQAKPSPLDVAEAFRDVPGFEGQADAMTKFYAGKMSYAEMRSLCG